MVDGVLGSYPLSSTPYRVWTDNGTHAYFLSMMAVRNQNVAAFEEVLLHKRVGELGLEEFAWRRPGVVVYHCPGYDFDLPRVVEEFGGPRPHDLSLSHPKAILVDPYSIPMKATILAYPKCAALQDLVAFLSARWGYYADEKEFLTLPSDSLLTSDGKWLTLIVDASGELDMNAVRASSWLYGARHHRIANGFVARCWDVTSFASHTCETRASDFVETSYNTVHRPLPPRVGNICSQSHRFHHRRFVAEFGYKREHNYPGTSSTANLFNDGNTTGIPRPAAIPTAAVRVLIVQKGNGEVKPLDAKEAATLCVAAVNSNGFPYAEEEKLVLSFAKGLSKMSQIMTIGAENASVVLGKLVKGNTF